MAQRLRRILLQGPAGLNYVTNSNLVAAEVITVKRNGFREYQVASIPSGTGLEVYHNSSIGRLYFSPDRKFNETELDAFGARVIEYVHVIYRGGGIVDTPVVEMPPPTPEPPPVAPIAGQISNNTFPLSGNQVDAVTFNGSAVTVGSYPSFGAFSFPVTASGSNFCLFKVAAIGVNKQMKITITTTTPRQLIVIDSFGNSQTLGPISTGIHTFNNVSIDGSTNCEVIMN